MTNNIIAAVYDFNEQIIGLKSPEQPTPLSQVRKDWFIKAIEEEKVEFEEAYANQDFIVQVDAIMDLLYFGIGRLQEMGLTREQAHKCFMAVHNANMTKKRGAQAKRGGDENDAVKPDGWIPPEEAIGAILFGGE